MTAPNWIKAVFLLSGVYDAVLGLAFLGWAPVLFAACDVPPPNHPGYVQFPALLLLVFGAMFLRIASDPVRHRELMPYGMGLKAAYAGVVLFHAAQGGIPAIWVPFAWADLVFLLLFAAAWRTTAPAPGQSPRA